MLVKLNVRNNISYDKEVMDAFRRGLEKHNIKPTTSSGEYDLSVQWGHKRIPKDSKDYLVIERGYYNDRFNLGGLPRTVFLHSLACAGTTETEQKTD